MKFSLKAKHLPFKSLNVRSFFLLIFTIILAIQASVTFGQDPKGRAIQATDTIKIKADSLKADSVKVKPKSDIETTINYSARDSINSSIDGQIVKLYGDAKIVYGAIELTADEVTIDYKNSTLSANGTRDSLGRRVSFPTFKDGPQLYEMKDIVYNFKTGRARITEVVTEQSQGYLHGETVFKNEKNELLSLKNSYTTCGLEHPHFRIRSTKTKAIPDDKIVSGPFYMEFNEIPIPIGFLFGMFPAQKESKSGIIVPSYGEDRTRGFSLRNGGYYFDVSEYFKLALTGDIYSKGGHAIYVKAPYINRYHYNGNLNFSFSKYPGSGDIEDRSVTKDYSLAWNHTPQSKGTGRFSASVNAASSTYNKNNNMNYTYTDMSSTSLNNISRKLSSNISYSKRFANTPFSMGLNLSHNQDLQTGRVDMQLPNLTVNMQNQYPFQRKNGTTTPLDNFSIGYSMAGSNRITNDLGIPSSDPAKDSVATFNFSNFASFFENGKKGIRHTVPIGYSFKAFRFFTISPNFSYEEKWYSEKLTWKYDMINNQKTLVVADTIHGFNRVANYSVSASLNTRLYGTYNFRHGKIKAIRHTLNPNVSFGITPDFTKNPNYFQAINDNGKITYKARHEGFVYGASTTGKSGSIGFNLGNSVEMKVKSEKDTVARKVSLLNSLSIGSAYNLVADSFKLSAFSMSANTTAFNNLLSFNMSATLDPYYIKTTYDETGKRFQRKVDEYAWKSGNLGRITSATIAVNTNLNPKARENDQKSRDKIIGSTLPQQEKDYLLQNPNSYVDFEIPWSLRVNYSLSYRNEINQEIKITQALQFSGDVSLSAKWKINFNSGYHFESKEFTQTTITIARDLHCWTMNFFWVPFGPFTSYNFSINVKASVLQDLKMERRKPFYDSL